MEELIWGKREKERKPISGGVLKQAVARAGGKCERCGTRLVGLRYHIHHRNRNPADNRLSNLEVLCPNCHSRVSMHRPIKKKERGLFDVEIPEVKISEIKIPEIDVGTGKRGKGRKKKEIEWAF